MRIPGPLLGLLILLTSCGTVAQSAAPQPGPVPQPVAQTAAPTPMQWAADHATLPSDAPFAWTWFTSPDLPDGYAMEPGELINMTANLPNSAYVEDLVWETGYVLKDLRFYSSNVPCHNCHEWDYILVGQQPDGSYAGFRARVFWDH